MYLDVVFVTASISEEKYIFYSKSTKKQRGFGIIYIYKQVLKTIQRSFKGSSRSGGGEQLTWSFPVCIIRGEKLTWLCSVCITGGRAAYVVHFLSVLQGESNLPGPVLPVLQGGEQLTWPCPACITGGEQLTWSCPVCIKGERAAYLVISCLYYRPENSLPNPVLPVLQGGKAAYLVLSCLYYRGESSLPGPVLSVLQGGKQLTWSCPVCITGGRAASSFSSSASSNPKLSLANINSNLEKIQKSVFFLLIIIIHEMCSP